MRYFFLLAALLAASPAMASPCQGYGSVAAFERQLIPASYNAAFDDTANPACLRGKNICERHYFKASSPGYFDDHLVYYITYGNSVVFASTGEHQEHDYGNTRGSPTAEADWNAAFVALSTGTQCRARSDK